MISYPAVITQNRFKDKTPAAVAQVFKPFSISLVKFYARHFDEEEEEEAVWENGFVVWKPEALIQFSIYIWQQVKYMKYVTWYKIRARGAESWVLITEKRVLKWFVLLPMHKYRLF